jgi:hypothetical protein
MIVKTNLRFARILKLEVLAGTERSPPLSDVVERFERGPRVPVGPGPPRGAGWSGRNVSSELTPTMRGREPPEGCRAVTRDLD